MVAATTFAASQALATASATIGDANFVRGDLERIRITVLLVIEMDHAPYFAFRLQSQTVQVTSHT